MKEPRPKTELEKLPPATQEGKQTFGCLMNGKAWVTETSIDAYAVYQSGILTITGEFLNPESKSISMVLLENNGEIHAGNYLLNQPPDYSGEIFLSLACQYEGSNVINGELEITKFDKVNYIISGLFEFTTALTGCDTLKITNGRFDLKYIP